MHDDALAMSSAYTVLTLLTHTCIFIFLSLQVPFMVTAVCFSVLTKAFMKNKRAIDFKEIHAFNFTTVAVFNEKKYTTVNIKATLT